MILCLLILPGARETARTPISSRPYTLSTCYFLTLATTSDSARLITRSSTDKPGAMADFEDAGGTQSRDQQSESQRTRDNIRNNMFNDSTNAIDQKLFVANVEAL